MKRSRIHTGVRTGRLVGSSLAAVAAAPYGPSVLFDARSTSLFSRVINIEDTRAKLLSAYGLEGEDVVQVHRLVMVPGKIHTLSDFCGCLFDGFSSKPQALYSKPFKECNEPVQMHCAQDELTLEGPGFYQLEFESADMLGRVYIEIQNFGG